MKRFRVYCALLSTVVLTAAVSLVNIAPASAAAPDWFDTGVSTVAPANSWVYDSAAFGDGIIVVGATDDDEGFVYVFNTTTGEWLDITPELSEGTTAVTSVLGIEDAVLFFGTENVNGAEIYVSQGGEFAAFTQQDTDITAIQDIAFVGIAICATVVDTGALNLLCFDDQGAVEPDVSLNDFTGVPLDVPAFPLRNEIEFSGQHGFVITAYNSDTDHGAVYQYDQDDGWEDITSDEYGDDYIVSSLAAYEELLAAAFVNTSNNYITIGLKVDVNGAFVPASLGVFESGTAYERHAKVFIAEEGLYASAETQAGRGDLVSFMFDTEEFELINPIGFGGITNRHVSALTSVDGELYASASTLNGGYSQFGVFSTNDFGVSSDSDGDGIDDSVEDGFGNGDGNDDGTPDSEQSDVATVANPVTGGFVTVQIDSADGCTQLEDVFVESEDELVDVDSEYDYPVGLVNYMAICDDPGDTAYVSVFYDRVITEEVVRKQSADGTFSDVETLVAVVSVNDEDVSVFGYDISDGGELDSDGLENAVIVDPIGPAAVQAAEIIPAPSTGTTGSLPATGSESLPLVASGMVLLLGGSAIIFTTRKRAFLSS